VLPCNISELTGPKRKGCLLPQPIYSANKSEGGEVLFTNLSSYHVRNSSSRLAHPRHNDSRTLRRRVGLLTTICLLAPVISHAQQSLDSNQSPKSEKPPVESEVTAKGMVSYGNWRIFAGGTDCRLYTAGVEYERHTWGEFLKARMDYAAEVLPVVLLRQPTVTDMWGNPLTKSHEIIPGVGFSPIGLRMLWRPAQRVKPYFTVKGGMVFFAQKALNTNATYENFSLEQTVGLQIVLTKRVDLRLGLFGDFHFSNAFIVPVNPGLDVMNTSFGLTYHLGK
jgi:Lipid A 3-O-deacylase (PagL)